MPLRSHGEKLNNIFAHFTSCHMVTRNVKKEEIRSCTYTVSAYHAALHVLRDRWGFLGSFWASSSILRYCPIIINYGCRRTSKKLLFALKLVPPASSFLFPDKSGINP